MNTRKKGLKAEKLATNYLKKHNYKIITTNFYSKFGEIDIIAYKDNTFHFIEVKSGVNFEPIYNITPSKLNKIIKTAKYYIKINKITSSWCIDAIIIKDKINHIKNITL